MTTRPKTVKCDSWSDLLVALRRTPGAHTGQRVFRGHADQTWKLASQFERWLSNERDERSSYASVRKLFSRPDSLELYRDSFLQRFKETAVGLPGLAGNSVRNDEWWIMGRHYGLVTPLLDWSRSPFVAAFFAYAGFIERFNPWFRDGAALMGEAVNSGPGVVTVWELTLTDEVRDCQNLSVVVPHIEFAPPLQRIRAQQSVMTRLTDDIHLDLESYLTSLNLQDRLVRYEMPGHEALTALADLKRMNLTFATLFPDPQGAARQANMDEYLSFK